MGVYRRKKNGRKGKTWWITYMVAGRQRRESSQSTNKRVAQNLLAIRKAKALEGQLQLPASRPPKFEEWAQKFLREAILHPNTKERYRFSIQALEVHFKGARLSQITPNAIEEFKQARLASGLNPSSVNRDLSTLRRMLILAKKRRLLGQSPFPEVEFLEERKHRRLPHIMTFEEQLRLLAFAPPYLRMLIILITETGLRVRKEALPLKWENVDLDNAIVRVLDSKTPNGKREIPLTELCRNELLRWKHLTGPDFSPYIFFNPGKPAGHLKVVRKVWATSLKSAKIDYFCTYDLRATFASRLGAAGVVDVFISQLMGHAGGLLQTYAKAIVEYRKQAIEKLEEYRAAEMKKLEGSPALVAMAAFQNSDFRVN